MYPKGSSCDTFNGKEGKCVGMKKCSKFYDIIAYWQDYGLENYIPSASTYNKGIYEAYKTARARCGYDGFEALICCDASLSYKDWFKIIPVQNVVSVPNVENQKEKKNEKSNEIDDDDDEAYFNGLNEE